LSFYLEETNGELKEGKKIKINAESSKKEKRKDSLQTWEKANYNMNILLHQYL
jgi:hypothetical protein